MASSLLLGLIVWPSLAAIVVPMVDRRRGDRPSLLFTLSHLVCLALAILTVVAGPETAALGARRGPWLVELRLVQEPPLGLALVLAAILLLALSLYSRGYARGARHGTAFLSLLFLEQAAVNLTLLAGDLLLLYAGLLSLSLALALMIGVDFAANGEAAALRLLVTLEIPTALACSGFWLIDARVGSVALTDLPRSAGWLAQPASWTLLLPIIVALVGRAGLAPLHSWAVAACRAAASPAAIALASIALPVGGVVVARVVNATLPLDSSWLHLLLLLGAATTIVSGIGALRERLALGWLGYLAVGQLGLAVAGLADGATPGRVAGWLGLAAASLTLALVGMGLGLAIRATGDDRLAALSRWTGSWRERVALLLGLLALCPLPPFASFVARRLLLADLLASPSEWHRLAAVLLIVGTFLLAVSVWRTILGLLVQPVVDPEAASAPATRRARRRLLPAVSGATEITSALGGVAFLVVGLGVLPPAWLLGVSGLAGHTLATDTSLGSTALALLPTGGGMLLAGIAARLPWLEGPSWRLAKLGQRLHLGRALDPYLLIGGALLAMGRFSALTLDQTLGRLARPR